MYRIYNTSPVQRACVGIYTTTVTHTHTHTHINLTTKHLLSQKTRIQSLGKKFNSKCEIRERKMQTTTAAATTATTTEITSCRNKW